MEILTVPALGTRYVPGNITPNHRGILRKKRTHCQGIERCSCPVGHAALVRLPYFGQASKPRRRKLGNCLASFGHVVMNRLLAQLSTSTLCS